MIDVVNVTHHYGVKPVLRNVNLHVSRGEVVALMGPNGCGKSTLMSLVAGIQLPLHGHVAIDGKPRRSSPEAELGIRKKVVYLPAEPWVPLGRTGREWILAVGKVWEVDVDRLIDHVDRVLELFDLKDKADSEIVGYSTGQKKKVALAAALVTEAPIMLLDEPFAGGLDPSGISALRQVLHHRASGDHYTIIFATPVPELVEELADRIAILHEGQIKMVDSLAGMRSQLGAGLSLLDMYEKVVDPQTPVNVARYLERERM